MELEAENFILKKIGCPEGAIEAIEYRLRYQAIKEARPVFSGLTVAQLCAIAKVSLSGY